MKKKLDEFITSIKAKESPFVYTGTKVDAHFLLSYDESIEELDDNDFRPFIIAALHVKGAKNIKSYVASTVIFTVEIEEGKSFTAIRNWKKYLSDVFGNELTFMLCRIKPADGNEAIFDKVPNKSIESQFDDRLILVREKFKTLK